MSVNYSDLTPGTPITWTNTGGTKVMNMKNRADAYMREGDKSATLIDSTKGFPELLEITAETRVTSTPTDGRTADIYLGFSSSASVGVDNPGGLTGVDAAVADVDVLPQLVFVGSIIMAGSLTTGVQRQVMQAVPKKEYVIPVFVNNSGQTTSNVDGETIITIRPWYRRAPIA